ncbi:PLDc N-terminal domain-containing protein [Actinomycetaceae bacterium TAE3-ERU4]|nr:PLDc N-terminal domain-containing protein [Actinomycetaceae bacterium TAE3-ERU4]
MNLIEKLSNFPLPTIVGLGILLTLQLILMVWALIRLVSDKRSRVVGLPRYIWGLIIVFGEIFGPLIFLVLHIREGRQLEEQRKHLANQALNRSGSSVCISSAIDGLYKK